MQRFEVFQFVLVFIPKITKRPFNNQPQRFEMLYFLLVVSTMQYIAMILSIIEVAAFKPQKTKGLLFEFDSKFLKLRILQRVPCFITNEIW